MSQIHAVEVKEVHHQLTQGKARLIDVREPDEHRELSIVGAVNIPMGQIDEIVAEVGRHADKTIVIHCRSGMRSMQVCQALIQRGVLSEVHNLTGGITAWDKQGLPVLKGPKQPMPLIRQMHCVVSVMLLCFIGCAVLYSPWFLIGPVVIALGLLNHALTGWCGMSKVLLFAPWNKDLSGGL